jgi:hypothetical protein
VRPTPEPLEALAGRKFDEALVFLLAVLFVTEMTDDPKHTSHRWGWISFLNPPSHCAN